MIKFGRIRETVILDPIELSSREVVCFKIEILWKQGEGHYFARLYRLESCTTHSSNGEVSEKVYIHDTTTLPDLENTKFYGTESCLGGVLKMLENRII
ncbi:hypothetical protein GKC56_07900 [Neisseriaceae bacterium PsAf]|nr:hypothetical protein [Neisseriaceae bacterium PsAf]MCV2503037.1 hypothetical protein [Neisseriaceae bacterium]